MNPPARTYQKVVDLPENKSEHAAFMNKLIAEGWRIMPGGSGTTVIVERTESVTNEGGSGRGKTILLD